MSQLFQYRPLSPSEQEIRLLEIPPNQATSPTIRLNLKHVRLRDTPQYWTLSYTWNAPFKGLAPEWDDPNALHKVHVNEKEFHVRWNLEAALRRLAKDGISAIWIDAICIDQNNIPERNHQVQMMRQIYGSSVCTFAWLGPDSDESYRVMRVMRVISHFLSSWDSRIGKFKPPVALDPQGEECQSSGRTITRKQQMLLDAIATIQLLLRSWFSRIWVVQEVALSQDVYLLWGEEGFSSWDSLESIILMFARPDFGTATFSGLDLPIETLIRGASNLSLSTDAFCRINHLRRCIKSSTSRGVSVMLDFLRAFGTTDARDRVYAGLGILHACGDGDVVPVDYSLPVADVFRTTTRAILEKKKDLSILGLCSASQMANLPSWAVDFTAFTGGRILGFPRITPGVTENGERLYCAGGNLGPVIKFEDGPTLVISGYSISALSFIGKPDVLDRVFFTNVVETLPKDFLSLLPLHEGWLGEWICQQLNVGLPVHHVGSMQYPWTQEDITQAFKRTICADMLDATNDAPPRRLGEDLVLEGEELPQMAGVTRPGALGTRTFAATCRQQFCLVDKDAHVGDVVFIAKGADTPYLLRPLDDKGEMYRFAGYAYVHGLMDGEILDVEGDFEEVTVKIV